MLKNYTQLVSILVLCLFSSTVFSSVTATLPRNKISENETFQLVISVDETHLFGGNKPDTSVLDKNFTLLGQSTRSQSSWVNGKKTEETSWVLTLKPKQAGIFTIPPISVGKQKSQAISLHVSPIKTYQSNGAEQQAIQDVFIEVSLDKNEAYVQEQIVLNIKLNDSLNLSNIGLSQLEVGSSTMVELSNTSYQRDINGHTFTTYELRYALFPQKSGSLTIPSITVTGNKLVTTSRRRNYEPVRIKSNAIQTTIKPIPSGYQHPHWLPAQSIKLAESFSQDIHTLQVGDAITRTVTLSGAGITAEQLPDIIVPDAIGLNIYPEAAQRHNDKSTSQQNQLTSSLTQSFSLVATQAGKITLPAVEQAWFNTATQSIEMARIEPREITIQANAALQTATRAQQASTAPTKSENNLDSHPTVAPVVTAITFNQFSEWPQWLRLSSYIAIGIFMLLLALIIYLLAVIQRLKKSQSTTASSSLAPIKLSTKQLEKLITDKNYSQLREAIIDYAQQQWHQQTIHSLSDIEVFIDEVSISTLRQLDASLYGQQEAPSQTALNKLIAVLAMPPTNEANNKLFEDLYPQ